jgi:hypothetical protein
MQQKLVSNTATVFPISIASSRTIRSELPPEGNAPYGTNLGNFAFLLAWIIIGAIAG